MSNSSGNLLIVAAPSGGGKTSLIDALLAEDERLRLSVSHTTRRPRPDEIDGRHYHFISAERFEAMVEAGEFLEHAEVFDCRYGTSRAAVEEHLTRGVDVILEIDWQGARQIRAAFGRCRSVFILPPSLEILCQRLERRATDTEAVIQRRMRDAQSEISHWDEFDYLLVNDDFDTALADLRAILRSLRLSRNYQQERHRGLLAELLGTG